MKQINNIFNPFILNQIINEVNYENESMYILPILINIFYKLAGHSTTKNNTPIKYIKDGGGDNGNDSLQFKVIL